MNCNIQNTAQVLQKQYKVRQACQVWIYKPLIINFIPNMLLFPQVSVSLDCDVTVYIHTEKPRENSSMSGARSLN